MRTWILNTGAASIDDMQLVERDVPMPGSGEVHMRVLDCSLNDHDQLSPLVRNMGGLVAQDAIADPNTLNWGDESVGLSEIRDACAYQASPDLFGQTVVTL